MLQNTPEEKLEQKKAKKSWLAGMRLLYPNFKKRMWANDSYRIKHPQIFK